MEEKKAGLTKERTDSIMALVYEPDKNMRYDYLQKKVFIYENQNKSKNNGKS